MPGKVEVVHRAYEPGHLQERVLERFLPPEVDDPLPRSDVARVRYRCGPVRVDRAPKELVAPDGGKHEERTASARSDEKRFP